MAQARLDLPLGKVFLVGHSYGAAVTLNAALPNAKHVRFPTLGHMAPITHPKVVNAAIEEFLLRP